MDAQQVCVFNLWKKAYSLCFGQAGTGKSYTLKQIITESHNKKYQLTCYTGIACLQYKFDGWKYNTDIKKGLFKHENMVNKVYYNISLPYMQLHTISLCVSQK